MLFNSFIFLELVIITFALYYLPVLSKFQIPILILSSLVFYSYTQPELVLLLLLSVAINTISSYFVVYGSRKNKKLFAVSGVACNLSILVFFKYSPLIATTFFAHDGHVSNLLINMPLPIGISFYTFQGISLVIDVYNQKSDGHSDLVPRSFIQHAQRILFFKSFFPQLVSGPIVKAHDFIPQIETKYVSQISWESSFKSIVLGYFLKMVIADNLNDFTFRISYPFFQEQSSLVLVLLLYGYSCQIFADFAGYSLIAIGISKLFGYNLMDNFNFPYISTSFREFWKRWHISLSSFLMEYLYIPLGGNKKGKIRTYLNLMLVMMLGGLWHGAAWSYAVWGVFHGLALAIERLLSNKIKIKLTSPVKILRGLLVFGYVSLAWLLFKLPDLNDAVEYLKSISKNTRLTTNVTIVIYVVTYSFPIVLYHLIYVFKERMEFTNLKKFEYILYAVMMFLILTNSGSSGSFIYFQF
jgi:alginate O-acetyltransferase complex protein AlgI